MTPYQTPSDENGDPVDPLVARAGVRGFIPLVTPPSSPNPENALTRPEHLVDDVRPSLFKRVHGLISNVAESTYSQLKKMATLPVEQTGIDESGNPTYDFSELLDGVDFNENILDDVPPPTAKRPADHVDRAAVTVLPSNDDPAPSTLRRVKRMNFSPESYLPDTVDPASVLLVEPQTHVLVPIKHSKPFDANGATTAVRIVDYTVSDEPDFEGTNITDVEGTIPLFLGKTQRFLQLYTKKSGGTKFRKDTAVGDIRITLPSASFGGATSLHIEDARLPYGFQWRTRSGTTNDWYVGYHPRQIAVLRSKGIHPVDQWMNPTFNSSRTVLNSNLIDAIFRYKRDHKSTDSKKTK